MFLLSRPLLCLCLMAGLAFGCGPGGTPPAAVEAQTSLRDRVSERPGLRGRIAERRAARQGDAQGMTISAGGLTRSYHVNVPSGVGAQPAALLVFHGGGGSGARMRDQHPIDAASEAGNFIAVYPDAVDGNWTDGRIGTAGGPDDVAFVRALIDRLRQDHGVDPGRVFATGISNGAMFTHKLACDAPGLVRAIAPVAGNMPEALAAACAPGRGTPVMMFNGTDDPLMPYQGGRPELDGLLRAARGPATDQMTSSEATADFWARINGCGGRSQTDLPASHNDGTTVTRLDWSCGADRVVLFRINGGGHTWPGSSAPARRMTGNTSREIDATTTMVDFFRSYGL